MSFLTQYEPFGAKRSQGHPPSFSEPALVVISAARGWPLPKFKELWDHRDLLYFLVWRDVKVRYKQTVLGASWAVLQPFMTMVMFSIFFGRLAKVPSDGVPYPIFAYTALIPWQLFAHAVTEAGNSLVANRQLLTKVYFPRLVIPLAPVLAGLADFGIAFLVLLGLMFYYNIFPGTAVLMLPLFLLLAVGSAAAVGVWLSALNVRYRDVRHAIPFLTQFWLFVTPIAYPSNLVPEPWRALYSMNPMAGVVEGFRWTLLGSTGAPGPFILISASVVVLLLLGGIVYFLRTEETLADVV